MLSDEVHILNKEISRTVARASNAEKGKIFNSSAYIYVFSSPKYFVYFYLCIMLDEKHCWLLALDDILSFFRCRNIPTPATEGGQIVSTTVSDLAAARK